MNAATFEKPKFPNISRHPTTWVTSWRADESNISEPAKSILPFIFAACASCVERAVRAKPAAISVNMVFVRFFMGCGELVFLNCIAVNAADLTTDVRENASAHGDKPNRRLKLAKLS